MRQKTVINQQLSVSELRKSFLIAAVFLITVQCSQITARAQNEVPANVAPPPVKIVTKEEKTALESVNDLKNRTKLALDLMEARLKKAEELNTQENFNAMFTELGGFHALMDDAIKFLNKNDNGGGKVLNTLKRFEMALRAFSPRIELIRRELPEKFEFYVRSLAKTVRDIRSKAVEPMFTNSILPNTNN